MKFFRIFGRSIRDAFRSIGRNFSLSLASIFCVMITLIVVAIALILSFNIDHTTDQLKDNLSIVVFVSNEADSFDLTNIESQIKELDSVYEVIFKSKSEVKEEMMESNETFETIMKEWDDKENPLQNVYIVKVDDASKLSSDAEKIKEMSKVDIVKYGEGMIDDVLTIFDGVEKGSIIGVFALFLVSVFLIINTIKLTIFSRKREISIMRLVGASNFSIKLPFVFEGMFIGLIGAIVPILVTIYGYFWMYDVMGGKFISNTFTILAPSAVVYKISLLIALIGMIVGMIGSGSAVRKHLKV